MNDDGRKAIVTVQGNGRTASLRLPGVKVMPPAMRRHLREQVLAVLSHDGPTPDYDHPVGDPGLFGPDSMTWRIHADFPSMMAGGLAALMLQMLHPLALAAVWDYSNFREDILGRLRSTTAFVGRTTYAPRAPAEEAIETVRRIHRAVTGTAADGRVYRAEDPHLLNWVHCAECWCFLRAYETYCQGPLSVAMQNRYLQEMALVAEALGARDVPKTVDELDAFFVTIHPELCFDERTHEVLGVLECIRLPIPMAGLSRNVFLGAAAVLLPDWALALVGRTRMARLRDRAAAGSLKVVSPSIRDAMAEGGLAWRACARTGADYERLFDLRQG